MGVVADYAWMKRRAIRDSLAARSARCWCARLVTLIVRMMVIVRTIRTKKVP